MGSAILINPPVMEDLQLEKWHNKNRTEIMGLLQNESYKDVDVLLPYPEENDIVPLARAIEAMKGGKPTWVRGLLSLPHQERSFTQTGCANCFKPLEADVNWIITCPVCKQESEVQVLSRATFGIEDETGSICGTISTPNIEKFIHLRTSEIRNAEVEGTNLHEIIEDSIKTSIAMAFVRSYETWYQQRPTTRFVMVNAYKSQQQAQIQEQSQTTDQIAALSFIQPPSPRRKHKRDQPQAQPSNDTESSSVGSQRATKRME